MSGFGDDEIAENGNGGERENVAGGGRIVRRRRALTMFDSIRATMYSTMAGMIEAGLDEATAASFLSDEYGNQDMGDASASVSLFFEELKAIREQDREVPARASARIGEVALRAFGEKFVVPEEMALLKALAVTKSPEKIFLACSRLLGQYERERASGIVPTYRRAVG
ncbi:hypothetical protein G6L37_01450 [Agrobacterium rubi]|nr:hypothetical protein [Agrobacterium rubi]NTF24058.1 hypothetical protein [Agrobacterium rubi]